MRGCYCGMATAHMLGLDTAALAQAASMVSYVQSCQVRVSLPAEQPHHLASALISDLTHNAPERMSVAVNCQASVEGRRRHRRHFDNDKT